MKLYKLSPYLPLPLLLSFVTTPASQEPLQLGNQLYHGIGSGVNVELPDNNPYNNNTNEDIQNSSSYTHGDQKDIKKWFEHVKYKDLRKKLYKLYQDGIARPIQHIRAIPLTYFVVGPTGAGKSTFIFTLQGNQVTKVKKSEKPWGSDDEGEGDNNNDENTQGEKSNFDNETNDTGDLILTKTVNLPTPKVARSSHGVTEGIKIYYTGKNIKKPMAFCDTEGFLGKRKGNTNNAKKMVASYAPSFVLKANQIGGIIFLISQADILSARARNFFPCVEFLNSYFHNAMIGTNRATLKKSIMLIINKQTGDETSTLEELAFLIQESYKDYYEELSKNNKNDLNTNQNPKKKSDKQEHIRSRFKNFFKSNESKENKNKPKPQQKTDQPSGKPLGLLKPFLSLLLKKEVSDNEIDTITHDSLDPKKVRFFYPDKQKNIHKIRTRISELTPLHPSYLSLQDNPISQELIKKIINRTYEINGIVNKIDIANQELIYLKNDKKTLERTSQELKDKRKNLCDLKQKITHNTDLESVFCEQHKKDLPTSRTAGYQKYLQKVKNYGWFRRNFWTYDSDVEDYVKAGYLRKQFVYQGSEPVYSIVIEENNGGKVTWHKPKKNFIEKNYKKEETSNEHTIEICSKQPTGIKQNKWYITHTTAYEKNARCKIEFLARKCDLRASKLKIHNNDKKINHIDNAIKALKNSQKIYHQNEKIANECKKNLAGLEKEMRMINCWIQRIFRPRSSNQQLIEEYMQSYKKIVLQKNTKPKLNSNHLNNQPNPNQQECKEDGEDNTNNSPLSLTSSVVGITAVLANKLNQN